MIWGGPVGRKLRVFDSSVIPKVRIIHETNPWKYFPAIFFLAERGRVEVVGAHSYSVVKGWLRGWLRERLSLGERTYRSFLDLRARILVPFVRDEVVVLGFAPWDWRMIIYGIMARRNLVVYHTSWPYWELESTPQQYSFLNRPLQFLWQKFLRNPNVVIVCILDETRMALLSQFRVTSLVIPHAVPRVFFDSCNGQTRSNSLRLIYVGSLSVRKGVARLLELMDRVQQLNVSLTIIGDGPLRESCAEAAGRNSSITYLGSIRDRELLAHEMSRHDVLMVLSLRDSSWEELFGIVIAEASAAGLGVIASDHIGPRSLLGHLKLGNLFSDDDDDGPIGLVRKLAADAAALDRFKVAHKSLAEEFREDAVAAQWAAVLGANS